MYRDMVGDPERFTAGGRQWWAQQFCHSDGTLKAVRLYDADGEFVEEFTSMEEAVAFAQGGPRESR